MDNTKRLPKLLGIFIFFQIANFVVVYNLSFICPSNDKINGTCSSMRKLKKRTHT